MKRMISPSLNEKSNKQSRQTYPNQEDDAATSGPLKTLVDGMMKCIDETRAKIAEEKLEREKTKQRIEQLKTERENLKSDQVQYDEKLQNQQRALDEKKQELNSLRKMAPEYVKKAKAVVQQKQELVHRVNAEVANIDRALSEYKILASRVRMAAERTAKRRDDVKTTLDFARKQVTITDEELQRLNADHQVAIADRRRQWNDLNSQIQEKRRSSEQIRADVRQIEDEIEAMHTRMSANERQRVEMVEKTKELENKIAIEERVARDIERLESVKQDLASSELELEGGTEDIRTKLNGTRGELEATEAEFNNDKKLLTNLKEQEENDEGSHVDKIKAVKSCLQERMQALATFQNETKEAQDRRNADWKEKEKQYHDRMEKQRVHLEELKKQFESISGMDVMLDRFRVDCSEIMEFKQKVQKEKDWLIFEIGEHKRRADEIVLEDEEAESAKKSPTVTRDAPSTERKEDKLTGAKSVAKHVTFKRTPVFYEPDARPEVLQDPKPPTVPLTKPVPPRTPSPKKPLGPPAKPQSARAPNRGMSQWSDSSEDSISGLPNTQAFLRKSITKRTAQAPPGHLGIF